MLKRVSLILAGVFGLVVVLGAATSDSQQAEHTLKSVHLFNLPDGVTEEDLSAALKTVNDVIAEMGYEGSGYRLWKVIGDQAGDYTYLWEGVWPNREDYAAIHESSAYERATESVRDVMTQVMEGQVYNRYGRVY
jgi:hypothetical protein